MAGALPVVHPSLFRDMAPFWPLLMDLWKQKSVVQASIEMVHCQRPEI